MKVRAGGWDQFLLPVCQGNDFDEGGDSGERLEKGERRPTPGKDLQNLTSSDWLNYITFRILKLK